MKKSIKKFKIILISLLFANSALIATINVNSYERLLNSNQLDKLKSELHNCSDEDNALFYKEKLNIKVSGPDNYNKISNTSSSESLKDKALLEIVNLKFLKREYQQIIDLLNSKSCSNVDVLYWKALACYKTGDYNAAISEAEKVIKYSSDCGLSELSYITIADSYIKLGDHNKAISKLEELKNSQFINHIPVVHLKTAHCCIKLGKYNLAAGYLKKIIKDYPFSQYSLQAEEMYTGIIGKYDHAVTIKDPVTKNTIPEEVKEVKTTPAVSVNENCVYLQTGAFSARKNAEKQLQSLKNMGYPGILTTRDRAAGNCFL